MRKSGPVSVPPLLGFGLSTLLGISGCDLNPPASVTYDLPHFERLTNVPFNSSTTTAIAWHPDGRRLAVAERSGAELELMGLQIADPSLKALGLRLKCDCHFATTRYGQSIVGEDAAGMLVAWPLDGSSPRKLLSEPVYRRLWSVSENGEGLIYVPQAVKPGEPRQVIYLNPNTGVEKVIFATVPGRSIQEVKILPDGSGALVLYSELISSRLHFVMSFYDLPSAQEKRLLSRLGALYRMMPSRDGTKIAFLKSSPLSLLIFDLHAGFVDSLANFPEPLSDLVWTRDDRWIALFKYTFGSNIYELRAFDLRSHHSTVLVQGIPVSSSSRTGAFSLIAIGDTLAFFRPTDAAVSVFDKTDYSLTPWLKVPYGTGIIETIAWHSDGEQLFIYQKNPAAPRSTFHLIGRNSSASFSKERNYSSVAMLPGGKSFLASISSEVWVNDLYTDGRTVVLPYKSQKTYEFVGVHPSGRFAGILEYSYLPSESQRGVMYLLLDLFTYKVVDSINLPDASTGTFQWLSHASASEELSFIVQNRRSGDNDYDYYHVSLNQRAIKQVFGSLSRAYAVYPQSRRFSVLVGNTLMTMSLVDAVN